MTMTDERTCPITVSADGRPSCECTVLEEFARLGRESEALSRMVVVVIVDAEPPSRVVDEAVKNPGYCQNTTDDGAGRSEEVRQRLAILGVNRLERRDLVVEEDTGNASEAVRDVSARALVRHSCERGSVGTGRKVALVGRDRVLLRLERVSGQRTELGGDDLEEVLEHVLALLCLGTHPLEWILDAQLVLDSTLLSGSKAVVLLLGAKAKFVNDVTKVVVLCARAGEVRDEIVDVHAVALEGFAGRQMEAADHLVDVELARDTAAFLVLLLDLFGPTFGDALVDVVRVRETPSLANICLSHLVASVAASACWGLTAVAFTTVVLAFGVGDACSIALEALLALRNDLAIVAHACPLNVVLDIVDVLSRNVHDVEREQVARNSWEGDVHVDGQLLAAGSIHLECWLKVNGAVVDKLADGQHDDQERRDERDEGACVGTDAHIVHRLR